MKALIVDEPWMSLLLAGQKTWEMRSRHTTMRGRIALIRKGAGQVVGVADLVDSFGPLDAIAWRAHQPRHRIPLEQQQATANWDIAWVLESVRPLIRPVPYDHPNGAVVWVNLTEEVVQQLQVQHGPVITQSSKQISLPKRKTQVPQAPASQPDDAALSLIDIVPVARDGSWFSPRLHRSAGFTIGAKGEEFVVATYPEALKQLRDMAVPRWRRPNSRGNWGIVSGAQWKRPDELA